MADENTTHITLGSVTVVAPSDADVALDADDMRMRARVFEALRGLHGVDCMLKDPLHVVSESISDGVPSPRVRACIAYVIMFKGYRISAETRKKYHIDLEPTARDLVWAYFVIAMAEDQCVAHIVHANEPGIFSGTAVRCNKRPDDNEYAVPKIDDKYENENFVVRVSGQAILDMVDGREGVDEGNAGRRLA